VNAEARRRAALVDELGEVARRLENVQAYVKWTAKGGAAESPKDHAQWLRAEKALYDRQKALRQELQSVI